jgi:pimeloyl-ACP methyl ester carboxylesterase
MARRPNPSTASTITLADGRRVGVRRWGAAGPACLLLHGLLDSSAGWHGLAAGLPYRSVALDLAGFGASDLPTRPRISAYVDDVAEAVDALGLSRFVAVGHSLGGAVAAGLAERLGDRVGALVLLAPAGFGRLPLAEAISIPGLRTVARRMLPFALSNGPAVRLGYRTMVANGHEPESAIIARVTGAAATLAPGAVAATQAVVAAGLSPRAFHRRGLAYGGPSFAVWGDRDRLVPSAHAAGVQAALPQARVEVWRGMGHHPQRERPTDLAAIVARAGAAAGTSPAPVSVTSPVVVRRARRDDGPERLEHAS